MLTGSPFQLDRLKVNEYNKVAKKKNIGMWWEGQGRLSGGGTWKKNEGRVGLEWVER